MRDKIVPMLEQLVAIPSVTSDRQAAQKAIDFLGGALHPSLVRKRIAEDDKASLLIALEDTLDFDVLILAHVDVVPAPAEMFQMKQDGDRLLGRGVGDMKGPIAGALSVLNGMAADGIKKKIGMLVVTDEEGGGKITAWWIREMGIKTKILLDADNGEDINVITEKSKRTWHLKLSAVGTAAHGARPWDGECAIDALNDVNAKLRALFPPFSKKNPPADEWVTTAHIGTIQGGKAPNVIAPSAFATWDFRLINDDDTKKVQDILDSLPDGMTYETISMGDPVVVDTNNPAFLEYKSLIEAKTGAPVTYDFTGGATDARFFVPMGALIIPHHPTGSGWHTDDEWLSRSSLGTWAEILNEFLRGVK